MDEALVLRDRYAADIIHLIGDYPRGSGKASILRKNAADPAAFAVSVSKSLSSRPLLLAHEVGHVMGLLHDRYTVSRYSYPDYTPPAYAHGYVNQRAFDSGAPEGEARWHTIMALQFAVLGCGILLPRGAALLPPRTSGIRRISGILSAFRAMSRRRRRTGRRMRSGC